VKLSATECRGHVVFYAGDQHEIEYCNGACERRRMGIWYDRHCWLKLQRHSYGPVAPLRPGNLTHARRCHRCGQIKWGTITVQLP
jgi:hypothetical protein